MEPHFSYLTAELKAAQAAPLSAKKAMLVAMLADSYVDRLFAAQRGEDDILRYREGLAAQSPALALVMALCSRQTGAPTLVTESVTVPIEAYRGLGIEDFMVSLYNDHSVQRVRIALADGRRRLAHEVLDEAVDFLGTLG